MHKYGVPIAVFVNLHSFLLEDDRKSIEKEFDLLSDRDYSGWEKNEKLAFFIDYCFIESTTKKCGSSPYDSRNLLTGETISHTASEASTVGGAATITKRTNKLDSGCLVPTEARSLFER